MAHLLGEGVLLLLTCWAAAAFAEDCQSTFLVFPTARIAGTEGSVAFFVAVDNGASAAAVCRRKGFGGAGGTRTATLGTLRGLGAINAATGQLCNCDSCLAYTAIECVAVGRAACVANNLGSIGRNNVGPNHFGVGNQGDSNVGSYNEGAFNTGVGNKGDRNFGISLRGKAKRSPVLATAQSAVELPATLVKYGSQCSGAPAPATCAPPLSGTIGQQCGGAKKAPPPPPKVNPRTPPTKRPSKPGTPKSPPPSGGGTSGGSSSGGSSGGGGGDVPLGPQDGTDGGTTTPPTSGTCKCQKIPDWCIVGDPPTPPDPPPSTADDQECGAGMTFMPPIPSPPGVGDPPDACQVWNAGAGWALRTCADPCAMCVPDCGKAWCLTMDESTYPRWSTQALCQANGRGICASACLRCIDGRRAGGARGWGCPAIDDGS
eukprot:scaffold1.g5691.t1